VMATAFLAAEQPAEHGGHPAAVLSGHSSGIAPRTFWNDF
jgi:hypothetical protein